MVTRIKLIHRNVSVAADLTRCVRNPHNGLRFDIDVVFGNGRLYRRGGTDEEPTYTLKSGWHMNLLADDTENLPAALLAFEIFPETPDCQFS